MFQSEIHSTNRWLPLFGMLMTYLSAIHADNENASSEEGNHHFEHF